MVPPLILSRSFSVDRVALKIAGCDQLVVGEPDLTISRLRGLAAGFEICLEGQESFDELNARDAVDDPVQLTLAEASAAGPPGPRTVRRATDQRVEIHVKRVLNVILDSLEVGQWRGSNVHRDAYPFQTHRQ